MTNQRIQIPAYTDHWMMGDRYGEIVKITRSTKRDSWGDHYELAHVKLDKSGKTLRFPLTDCTPV
jgi:hypothetical protein